MTTVGRLADVAFTIDSKNENVNVEVQVRLLVVDEDDDDKRYFRLRNRMTLYKMNEPDFVKPFDRLIVRLYVAPRATRRSTFRTLNLVVL